MKSRVISTIRGQVYQLLKQAICDGEYKPGQWLQENELAEQFSVSRSPIREALRQLSSDGLVVEIPNKGVFVRDFTPKDIQEIFDLRVMMENYSINEICTHTSEEARILLTDCLNRLTNAYQTDDRTLYTDIDTELHDLFIRLGGNSFLTAAYERVHTMTQLFRAYSLTDQKRFDDSIKEHQSIVENILANHPKEAQEINQCHLQLAKEQIQLHLAKDFSNFS